MFTTKNPRFIKFAKQAGIELSEEIELFAELVAEECADIAENTWEVNLPAAPVIRRHFNIPEPKR
jgi:hypothetical protein